MQCIGIQVKGNRKSDMYASDWLPCEYPESGASRYFRGSAIIDFGFV